MWCALNTTLCNKSVSLTCSMSVVFSGYHIFLWQQKIYFRDITEIFLKVALWEIKSCWTQITIVLEMKILTYWSESNFWINFYIHFLVLNKTLKNLLVRTKFPWFCAGGGLVLTVRTVTMAVYYSYKVKWNWRISN